ncbi:MAG TPA: DUF2802 domain-containing protein [Rhodocyclaceae bacterium]|nr:DUF2802 domain-containing protein [Rhodocyclaceae bacterium]
MLREIIWLIIAVLFGYVVFQLYRVMRLEAKKPAAGPVPAERAAATRTPSPEPQAEAAAGEDLDDDDGVFVFDARPRMPSGPWATAEDAASPWTQAAPAAEGFQQTLELQQLRRDMVQLRAEMSAQREELAAVRADLRAMNEQLEATLASQGVSPEYNEALVFARRGLGAEAISERCGISMAEAELVRSLAKGGGRSDGDAR